MDRSQIRKGTFLVGGACSPDGSMVGARPLQRQFPHFKDALEAAGPSPEQQRLAEIAADNRELEERVAALKAKVAAFCKATGRS